MTQCLRMVIFDVDGTLVDSQADIVASMAAAFEDVGLDTPARGEILSIVGLSLPQAMAVLAPDADHARMVAAYKDSYVQRRSQAGAAGSSPLYPGARAAIERLYDTPGLVLGLATGKSRRGLDILLEAHELDPFFGTQQVADHHPSKPHPSMIRAALDETGVLAQHAVMVGDTTFDMQMAQAAGVPFVGVDWGYHPVEQLTDAAVVLSEFSQTDAALSAIWGD